MHNKFSERLYELRTENNITRKELANKLNVTPRLISYWENNERECSFDMLLLISEILTVSVDYLLGKTDY